MVLVLLYIVYICFVVKYLYIFIIIIHKKSNDKSVVTTAKVLAGEPTLIPQTTHGPNSNSFSGTCDLMYPIFIQLL